MTPQKHQQLILLDPDKATALDLLAKRLGVVKQTLLREAVDDLLVVHGAPPLLSGRISRMRTNLEACEILLEEARNLHSVDASLQGLCVDVIMRLRRIRQEFGEPEKEVRRKAKKTR